MIVNGKEIAENVLEKVRKDVSKMACAPKLRVVFAGNHPAIEMFVRIKERRAGEAGIVFNLVRLQESVSTEDLIDALSDGTEDAIVVQLPLPEQVDTAKVLNSIPSEKDADVLSHSAYTLFTENSTKALLPPVAFAVREVLDTHSVLLAGKRAVVVGDGILVGKPVARFLSESGAVVEVITNISGSLEHSLPLADIIVSGAGSPRLITPDLISDGVVLIDAGSSELKGVIEGDIDPSCTLKASLITPVPGGIGPITIAGLLQNVLTLAMRRVA